LKSSSEIQRNRIYPGVIALRNKQNIPDHLPTLFQWSLFWDFSTIRQESISYHTVRSDCSFAQFVAQRILGNFIFYVAIAGWELTVNAFPSGQVLKWILPSRRNERLSIWGTDLNRISEETTEFIVLHF
jgi:hypothetical protein